MITQSEVRRLFSYNRKTGILKWKIKPADHIFIGDIAGSFDKNGYIQIGINRKVYLAHRIIWLYVYGYLPENFIDHKDRIKHHNWIDNLREATNQCNIRNTGNRIDNTSGVKGVYYRKRTDKWTAQIVINRKNNYLGSFDDFKEAVAHRLAAEQCVDWSICDTNSSAYAYIHKV